MNRGAGKRTIFHNAQYFQIFLELFKDQYTRYCIEIHAYCLMGNHYHLFVRTPHANLSGAMRYLDGVFAQKHNYLRKKDGYPLEKHLKNGTLSDTIQCRRWNEGF